MIFLASYCYDCAEEIFGDQLFNSFMDAEGEVALCEGCGGYILVGKNGRKLSMIKDLSKNDLVPVTVAIISNSWEEE